MSCNSASASTPSCSAFFASFLSLALCLPVSPGSTSFSRNFFPLVTRYGLHNLRAASMTCLVFIFLRGDLMVPFNAHSASQARASASPVSGNICTGPLRRPAPVKARTCAPQLGLPTTAIFRKSLRCSKKKSVSPHASLRSQPVKFSSKTRSLTGPLPAIFWTNSACTASNSDFFSSPARRRRRRRSGCCSRIALMNLSLGYLGIGFIEASENDFQKSLKKFFQRDHRQQERRDGKQGDRRELQ